MSLGIHFIDFFADCFWFYPMCLGYPASGSWILEAVLGWAPSHGMGLKLDQIFTGHSPNFYATFTTAYLVGRKKNCRLKVLRLVGVPIPPLEVFPGYRS